MPSHIDRFALRFCQVLAEETGWQPMQWRALMAIAARARILPRDLDQIVALAIANRWLETKAGYSVRLTYEGRKL